MTWQTNGPTLDYINKPDERFTLVRFYGGGMSVVWSRLSHNHWCDLGIPVTVWSSYADALAALVAGAKLHQYTSGRGNETFLVSTSDGGPKCAGLPLAALVGKEEQFFAAIDATIGRIREALSQTRWLMMNGVDKLRWQRLVGKCLSPDFGVFGFELLMHFTQSCK